MHDDGVVLVALDHANVEEAGVFAVHHVVHQAALAVAVVLRRLDQPDRGINEHWDQILEPVHMHDVIGVQHADDGRVGRGVHAGQAQRAGLEAGQGLGIDEFEALAERAAMIFDRAPQRRVGRVVDDEDAFEVRVIEPRDRVEGEFEHFRRLVAGRNMDRHFRSKVRRCRGSRRDQPARLAAKGDGCDFFDPGERDHHQGPEQKQTEAQREGGARHEIMAIPIGEDRGDPRAHRMDGCGKKQRLGDAGSGQGQDRQRQQEADEDRDARDLPVVRIHDRPGPGEFRVARGVEQAPIGADAAFEYLPGLIDGLDDVVIDAERLRVRDEVPHHDGLLHPARIAVLQVVSGARPPEFGNDDALARKYGAQLVIDEDRLIDRLFLGKAFPVGQDVRRNEIDGRRQLGMLDPDVPDFSSGDRYLDFMLRVLDQLDELVDRALAAVDGLVADDEPVDIAVLAGELDGRAHLSRVAVLVPVDPGPDGDLQVELVGDRRHELDAGGRGIGADRLGIGCDGLEIRANLLGSRALAPVGVLGIRKRSVRNAGERPRYVGRGHLVPRQSPDGDMHAQDERHDGSDEAHGRDQLGLNAETRTRPLGSTAAMRKPAGLGLAV